MKDEDVSESLIYSRSFKLIYQIYSNMHEEDSIRVGECVFHNFEQNETGSFIFNYSRIDEKPVTESDNQTIIELANQIGLWEDYHHLNEITYDSKDDSFEPEHRSGKYLMHFHKSVPFGTPYCVVRHSVQEARIQTKGKSPTCDIDLDLFKQGLHNVGKWKQLKEVMKQLNL